MDLTDDMLKGKRINVHDEANVQYWCNILGCEEPHLFQAVLKVGDSAVSVEAYLAMNCLLKRRNH